MRRLRSVYGAGPGHFVVVAVSLGVAAYAVWAVQGQPWTLALWFVGAIAVHDFVLLPLYSLAYQLLWRAGRVGRDRERRVPVLHHLVVPAAISGLLLLVWLPLILRLNPERYHASSGLYPEPYLWRWLAITAALFAVSGIVYALRRRRLAR